MGILGVAQGSSAGGKCRPFVAVAGLALLFVMLLVCTLLLAPGAFLRNTLRGAVCESPAAVAATRAWVIQSQQGAAQSMIGCKAQDAASAPATFSILMGVFSTASRIERRNIIRLAYGVQSTEVAQITIRFIVGKPKDMQERLQLGLEAMQYNDIIVLDIEENMNKGKTWSFYATVAALGVRFDYVMKVDDDSYVRIDNLAASLATEPRTDLYYGYVLPCDNQNAYSSYMAGMGYVVTWDLVEYISASPIVREKVGGYSEDKMTGDWLNAGGRAKNRVSKKPLFYDHPAYTGRDRCTHALVPETILVHQLKTTERWMNVLQFFEGARVAALPTPH